MSTTTATTITVPARFWEDHVDRGCRCGDGSAAGTAPCPDSEAHEATGYGTRTRTGYLVELSEADRAELLSDARHYAEMGTASYGPEALGLIASARATIRRLETR